MTTISLTSIAKGTIAFGSVNAAVNASIAWGTKFISQIPTQDIIPALIAAPIHSFISSIVGAGMRTLGKDLIINYFLNGKQHPDKEEQAEADKNYLIIARITYLSVATLVTVITLPKMASLVHKTISYKEALAFAMIDTFATLFAVYVLTRINS